MQGVRSRDMKLWEELKNDKAGLELLSDWLGDGGEPVHQGIAEQRALVCIQCPNNTAPDWWDIVKNTIADWIRNELELKSKLKMSTTNDEKIHMCKMCGCCLKLKVWTPLDYIKKHVAPEKLSEAPQFCWMKS